MADAVDEKTCLAKHGEIERRFEVDNKRLNSHSEGLVDLKEVIIRLTVLQETSVQTMKDTQEAMKAQQLSMTAIDKRVNELEAQRVKLTEVHMTELEEQRIPFWSTPAGQLSIKIGVVVGAAVILVAIGKADPAFWMSIFGK